MSDVAMCRGAPQSTIRSSPDGMHSHHIHHSLLYFTNRTYTSPAQIRGSHTVTTLYYGRTCNKCDMVTSMNYSTEEQQEGSHHTCTALTSFELRHVTTHMPEESKQSPLRIRRHATENSIWSTNVMIERPRDREPRPWPRRHRRPGIVPPSVCVRVLTHRYPRHCARAARIEADGATRALKYMPLPQSTWIRPSSALRLRSRPR